MCPLILWNPGTSCIILRSRGKFDLKPNVLQFICDLTDMELSESACENLSSSHSSILASFCFWISAASTLSIWF